MAGALQQAEAKMGGKVSIRALGITNQRETTVVWDRRTGQPLHNAIVWLDGRTSDICARLETQLGSKNYFRPGAPISIIP